jgi:hypothetical protein
MAISQSETVNSSLQSRSVGRRAILAGIASTPLLGTSALAETDEVDAVLAAWREWRPLQCEDAALTPKMKAAFKALPTWVKTPQVRVLDTWCGYEGEINEVCDLAPAWMAPAIPTVQEAAKRELQDLVRRGEEHTQQCGYADLDKYSEELMKRQMPLTERIEASNSNHPIVIAAKIDIALSEAPTDEMLGDCPWVPIAAIVRSLLPHLPADMAEALTPVAEERGRIGELFGLSAEALS